MAVKVASLLLVFCLISTAYSQCVLNASILASQFALLCPNNVCLINSAFQAAINTLVCPGNNPFTSGAFFNISSLSSSPVTVALDSSVASSLTIGGLSMDSSASAAVTLQIPTNAVVTFTNGIVLNGASVVNVAKNAVVRTSGNIMVAASASLVVAGNVSTTAAANVYGRLQLAGDYVAESAAQTAWVVVNTAANARGTIQVSGSATASAYITGNGGIDANVQFTSNVTLAAGNSPGTVYVNGDLSMSSTTTLEIDVDSNTNFDRILIQGRFNRDGILYADFENGYVPNDGNTFTFATHSSSSGDFNLARGNFDKTLTKVNPNYGTLSTSFTYGSASSVALPIALIALCIIALVF